MKYLRQLMIILFICFLGQVLEIICPIPIPGIVIGLILLFLALCTGIIKIEMIEESQNVQAANAHDYYYVPAFYVGGVKVHEGVPTFEKIENVLKEAIK